MSNKSIESLEYISDQFNRYLAPSIFLFGIMGNIMNCLVLSQRTLRSNPCALLFLASSFIGLISILLGLPTRILAGWHVDPTATINWICKTRVFIVFSTRTMSIWLITLATIDRWLISSINIHRRQMSNLKNVKREIFITIILSILSYIHMFPCYGANNIDAPLKCYENTAGCLLMTDLTYVLFSIIIPLILMIIFGLLTISHVHPTIDRWLISSINIHRRQMSNLKNVKREIFIIIILSILSYIHMFPCYGANNIDAPLKCYENTAGCLLMTDLTYALFSIIIPLILMIIFGLLTISHVHRIHTRVAYIDNTVRTIDHSKHVNQNSKKTDHHLLRMLLLQIFSLIVLCIPQAVQKLYMTFKPFGSGSKLEDAIKTFLYNIDILLAFMASAMPFYIYVLAGGSVIRKASINLIRLIQRKIAC
ncbi:unnamed protein product [Rotaria sordida]|uniref:G-protein coupled receptors family 1 profile domain-containing protein n=1 Tax=Rotaria sordida TaxID=392033 RepID=A0A814CAT0_9BILA|nr:unnamed protein product [Rotaria sordida]